MSGVSNHFDTILAIKSVIDGLSLSGLTGGTIIQEVANYQDAQLPLPCVIIAPYGPEKLGEELNDRDGCYYGTLVAIVAKTDVNSLETRLGWRQKIRRNLNNHNIGSLPDLYNFEVEPGNCVEIKAWADRGNPFVSGMIVRAYFQEQRT